MKFKNNGVIFIVLIHMSLIIVRVFFLIFIHHCYSFSVSWIFHKLFNKSLRWYLGQAVFLTVVRNTTIYIWKNTQSFSLLKYSALKEQCHFFYTFLLQILKCLVTPVYTVLQGNWHWDWLCKLVHCFEGTWTISIKI